MIRHETRRVSDQLYRCSCGSEFRTEDDAEAHAANANAEARERDRRRGASN
jgi:hypothetical protein